MKNRLKELREQNNLYQKDIASMLGIAVSTYSYWEKGTYEPDQASLAKLADFFHVRVDYLLGRDEKSPPAERPQADISENFIKEFGDLFSDETFIKYARLYKLMKRVDESVTARRFADAMALLKHALAFAPAERQEMVKAKMQEVRRKSEEGSLFAPQPSPAPQPAKQMPPQQPVQAATPAPTAGQQFQPRPVMPAATQAVQAGTMQQGPLQPAPQQPAYATAQQNAAQYGNPQGYGADKDEEYDMDAFREDPYAEYVDFPQECRMRDEAQVEMSFT